MPPNSANYRMADRLTGGQLARILRACRAAGDSFQDISRRLYADHGAEVTDQTVNNWLAELGQDEAAELSQ